MATIQATPPALSTAIAAFVGLALIGGLIGSVGTVVVRRLRNPVGKYRLLYGAVLFPYAVLSYGVLALTGSGAALLTALPIPELLDGVLSQFVTFLAAGCIWLISYLPTVRGVRDVRDLDLTTSTAISKMTRYIVILCLVLTIVISPIQLVSLESSPLIFGIGFVVLIVGLLYASPWLIPVLRSTSTPTGERADRITQLCSRAGLSVRDTRVLDTESEETASTIVRGPPNYRRLFVTSTFLEVFDDETATAILAIEAGRLRTHVFEIRLAAVLVGGITLLASVIGGGPRWPLLGVSLGSILLGFGLARRRICAADDYAVEQVGQTTVTDALNEYADVHALEPPRRRIPNPLSITVPLGDRIDRIQSTRALLKSSESDIF